MQRDLKKEFDDILKQLILPFFKELGFRRSGNVFNRVVNDLVQVVDVQKSQWNNTESNSFTFNIGFFSPDLHAEIETRPIPKFLRSYDTIANMRLGYLSNQKDYWYELNESSRYEDVANELQIHLEAYLRPFLSNVQTLNSIADIVEKNDSMKLTMSPIQRIVLLFKVGEHQKAVDLLRSECRKPHSSVVYFERLNKIAASRGISL